MRCPICKEDVKARSHAERWGPEFAHATCVAAYNAGKDDERESERQLRRLLAVRVAMPHTCYDDGEAQGQEHGITIDFMREPAADIDAKLRALNVARAAVRERSKAARVPGCPFAVFDEFGNGADDRVQDYAARLVAAERERLCAAIKAADDKASEGDYMLDSDDCISVIRGTWNPEA